MCAMHEVYTYLRSLRSNRAVYSWFKYEENGEKMKKKPNGYETSFVTRVRLCDAPYTFR